VAQRKSFTSSFTPVVLGAALVLLAFVIGVVGRNWNPFASKPFERIGPTVIESVRSLSTLVTVEMVESTTVEKGNDAGWLNWARGDRIFMFAVAKIGAGVDLQKIYESSFEVDEDTGEVYVRLPKPEIVYVSLDNGATQVYDRDTGLFSQGDPRLETEARQAAETILLQQAIDEGILDLAADNAATALSEFLESLGYTSVEVEVIDYPAGGGSG
jgi:hypothetical protein